MTELTQEQIDSDIKTPIEELEPRLSKKESATLIAALRLRGAVTVIADFSGGGDSGNINDVFVRNVSGNPVELDSSDEIEITEIHRRWGSKEVKKKVKKSLLKAVEYICADAIEATGLDWSNNDGGQGELHIDLLTSRITVKTGVNHTEITEYTHEFRI